MSKATALNLPHPELAGIRPPCFDPEQWRDWVLAERESALEPGYVANVNGFCEHCTPKHQAAMVKARKCMYPDVVFVADAGIRPVRVTRRPNA